MCIDFTGLNKHCPKDPFALPRIDQIIDSIAGSELLCFLDAYSGYHQIRLKKGDELKTSFITPLGAFCYMTMPFGPKNAGAKYQRCDVAQPNDITMSCVPSYAKPPWTSKVNSFLFEISFPTLWNGMLLEHPPLCIARFDTMDSKPMGGVEEAQELISSKAYAWMRRRKRQSKSTRQEPAGPQAGLGRLPGRAPSRRRRPPGRPRPAPRPDPPPFTPFCTKTINSFPPFPFEVEMNELES